MLILPTQYNVAKDAVNETGKESGHKIFEIRDGYDERLTTIVSLDLSDVTPYQTNFWIAIDIRLGNK